jgi:hypothetical protein
VPDNAPADADPLPSQKPAAATATTPATNTGTTRRKDEGTRANKICLLGVERPELAGVRRSGS